jgi:hypothetical protein
MRHMILSVFMSIFMLLQGQIALAAGETGHSDLQRLLAAIYGLDNNAADYLATVNQSVDKVPLSAATQSGRASAKLHFGSVVTDTDIDQREFAKMLANRGNRTFGQIVGQFFKNNALGGGVASLGNAESAEALGKAIRNGDGLLYAMGLHYLLDVAAPFHDGYKGALENPIPGLNKLPFLHQFAFGHLADGTSPDKLSIGKVILAMDAMGPFLIALRESQRNTVGVNTAWLENLRSQGVDVDNSESIRDWFLRQPVVQETLRSSLPANRSADYARVISQELKTTLTELNFYNDTAYLDGQLTDLVEKVNRFRQQADTRTTVNDLITEMIDKAWTDGKLNERQVIRETTTDYFGLFEPTERLNDLIYDPRFEGMPEYAQEAVADQLAQKNTNLQHTRPWLIDQIRAKITRGMISQSWEKFNTSYLNDTTENAQVRIEQEAIEKIERHFFNRNGVYTYNAGAAHWTAVFKTWREMPKADRGNTFLEKIITFCDIVIKTHAAEGRQLHSLSFTMKAQIFIKTMSYIFSEEVRNPRTTKGNFAVRIKAFRDRIVAQIRHEFPEGLLTEKMLEKTRQYNEYINRKFNSNEAVGVRQTVAQVVRTGATRINDILTRPAQVRTPRTQLPDTKPSVVGGARVQCRGLISLIGG